MSEESTAFIASLQKAERFIYLGAGTLLVVAAAALLASAVYEMIYIVIEDGVMPATILLLDRVLLALMLAEVIYTITGIARRRRLEMKPFLIIGVIAAVRRMLIITAESVDDVNLANSHFQAVLVELALLGLIILVLAFSLRIIHGIDTSKTE